MSCKYQQLTSRFMDSLKITDEERLLDPRYDYCFCNTCCTKRGDRDYYRRGDPPETYFLPKDWRRFGVSLRLPEGISEGAVLESGHVCFYGPRSTNVESILKLGFRTPERNGTDAHSYDKMTSAGVDTKQIFMSPSIQYAVNDAYAPVLRYYDHETRKEYSCKLVFQLRVRPRSYKVGHITLQTGSIGRYIDDDHLMWSTTDMNAVVATGLLVKMT
ncbi:hypothetical protein ACJMK2_041369 [Sinanodonta woodiana]|uniref:Uncharacterized protein n=1 Tax=Sinanodonta woodiana TaxID=1069815 RepID=A0ABD3W6V7_SINWO